MWLLAVVPLVYILVCVIVSRIVYQPTPFQKGWWQSETEAQAHDVRLNSSDDVRLHAWWLEVPGSRIATLYLHGNGGNLSHRPGHLREMTAAGASVLIIDYRGYGKSEGHPTERGMYRDADAGYDYLTGLGYRPEQIVVQGESLGSAVAADLAARRPCAGLILECPFTSLPDMGAHTVPWIGRFFVFGFNTREKVRRVHVPVLVMHGDRDDMVPYEMGRAVYEAANQPKQFWTVEGAKHVDIVEAAGPEYRTRLMQFYQSCCR